MSGEDYCAGVGEYFSAGAVDWTALAEKRRALGLYYPLEEVFENWRASAADRARAARDYQSDYWQWLRESAASDPATVVIISEVERKYQKP